MTADRSVGGTKEEHRFPRLLSHGHQGPIVFELGYPELVEVVGAGRCGTIEDAFGVDVWRTIEPPLKGFCRATAKRGVPRYDIPDRLHISGRKGKAQIARRSAPSVRSLTSPLSELWSYVLQAANRKQISPNRNHDVVRGNQGAAVYRSEIRANVDQCQFSIPSLAGRSDHSIKGSRYPKRSRIAVKTTRPLGGEFVFGFREIQVPRDQSDPIRYRLRF